MSDYDLYDGTPPHEDVETSRAAAKKILARASTMQSLLLRQIMRTGDVGLTDEEAERLLGWKHQTLSARRRELVLHGVVKDSKKRRLNWTGCNAIVWVAVHQIEEHLNP